MLRRAVVVAGALGLLAVPAVHADQVPGGAEGCVATSGPVPTVADGQQIVYSGGCEYTATRDGGYAGAGDWTITITYPNQDPIVISSTDPKGTSQGCAVWNPDAKVTLEVTSGAVGIGNPYPSAADDVDDVQEPCPPQP